MFAFSGRSLSLYGGCSVPWSLFKWWTCEGFNKSTNVLSGNPLKPLCSVNRNHCQIKYLYQVSISCLTHLSPVNLPVQVLSMLLLEVQVLLNWSKVYIDLWQKQNFDLYNPWRGLTCITHGEACCCCVSLFCYCCISLLFWGYKVVVLNKF